MATIKTSKGTKKLSAPKKTSKSKVKIIFRDKVGESGDVTLETLTVNKNGTFNAESGKAYNKVVVNTQVSLSDLFGKKVYAYHGTVDGFSAKLAILSSTVKKDDICYIIDRQTLMCREDYRYKVVSVSSNTITAQKYYDGAPEDLYTFTRDPDQDIML